MKSLKQQNKGHYCLIALGANLPSATGTALETLQKSLGLFPSKSLQIVRISKWFSTPAFPAGAGQDFVNGAALIKTSLTPAGVLTALHQIEARMGRTRENRWEPRLCDLDLIAYDDEILPDADTFHRWKTLDSAKQQTEMPDRLILPHPRLQDRSFVLVPLNDIVPAWQHPVTGITISEMIAALPPEDLTEIREIST